MWFDYLKKFILKKIAIWKLFAGVKWNLDSSCRPKKAEWTLTEASLVFSSHRTTALFEVKVLKTFLIILGSYLHLEPIIHDNDNPLPLSIHSILLYNSREKVIRAMKDTDPKDQTSKTTNEYNNMWEDKYYEIKSDKKKLSYIMKKLNRKN